MKTRLSLLLSLMFAFCAFSTSLAQKADAATSKITALEAKWNDAYKRNDPAGMEALLSDDFIITVEDGTIFSKSGYLAHTADSDLHVKISGPERSQSQTPRQSGDRHRRLSRKRHLPR
jgi:Domain of unknown function (DUF4440)